MDEERCEECGMSVDECDCDDEEMSTEDLAENNNILLNALIDILVEKNIISEEELDKKAEELAEDDEDEAPEESEKLPEQ